MSLQLNYTNTTVVKPKIDEYVKTFTIIDVTGLIMLVLLCICIFVGNVFVISAFVAVERKMRTLTNYFVVSLAVSDILVGMFSVPCWMWVQITQDNLSSALHLVFLAFDILCGVASIVNLTIISLERLFAVIRPASHRNLSRKKYLIVGALSFNWIFALVNSGLFFVKVFYGWDSYNIYIVLLGFVMPALVIVGSYVGIYKVAQQHVTEQRRIEQEMRLAGMIAIVILLFIACWLPFFLINILFNYCKAPMCDDTIINKSIPFIKFLHYSNSMMNPLVYAYRNTDYRNAFKRLLFKLLSLINSKYADTRRRYSSATAYGTPRTDSTTAYGISRTERNDYNTALTGRRGGSVLSTMSSVSQLSDMSCKSEPSNNGNSLP